MSGYFWFGHKKHSPGNPPRWLSELSKSTTTEAENDEQSEVDEAESDPAEQQSGVNEDAGQPLES